MTDTLIVIGKYKQLSLALYGTRVSLERLKNEKGKKEPDLAQLQANLDKKRKKYPGWSQQNQATSLAEESGSVAGKQRGDKLINVEQILCDFISLNSSFQSAEHSIGLALTALASPQPDPDPLPLIAPIILSLKVLLNSARL
jgi:hypothetical protein